MKYDFDAPVKRENTCSAKYDERNRFFSNSDVIPLWIADMDFRTAQPVIDALKSKAEEGIFGYTSRPDRYFEAIRGWQLRRHGFDFDVSLASWSLGVVPAIASIVKLFTDPGDEVLIQTPVYNEFYPIIEDCGRRVLENRFILNDDGSWTLDMDDFAQKAAKAKLFLLCNPQNPTGRVHTREELSSMAAQCRLNNILMVSDEIHGDFVFHGKRHIPAAMAADDASNVITCISGTKTFNLAGLQACTVIFPNETLKRKFDAFWNELDISRNNAFSVVAMTAAFEEGDEWLDQLLAYIDGNFKYVVDYCAANIPQIKPNLPDATYLMWLDCRGLGMSDDELNRFMQEEAGLGLVAGSKYMRGLSGFMRLNTACQRSVLEKALRQLELAVNALAN